MEGLEAGAEIRKWAWFGVLLYTIINFRKLLAAITDSIPELLSLAQRYVFLLESVR